MYVKNCFLSHEINLIVKIAAIGTNINQKISRCSIIKYAMMPPMRANMIKPVLMGSPLLHGYTTFFG